MGGRENCTQGDDFATADRPTCWHCSPNGWLEDDVASEIVGRCCRFFASKFERQLYGWRGVEAHTP